MQITYASISHILSCMHAAAFVDIAIGAPAIRSQAAQATLAAAPAHNRPAWLAARPRASCWWMMTRTIPMFAPYYTAALDGLGVDYDTWDTTTSGEPSSAALANYATVIWFTGLNGYPDERPRPRWPISWITATVCS